MIWTSFLGCSVKTKISLRYFLEGFPWTMALGPLVQGVYGNLDFISRLLKGFGVGLISSLCVNLFAETAAFSGDSLDDESRVPPSTSHYPLRHPRRVILRTPPESRDSEGKLIGEVIVAVAD